MQERPFGARAVGRRSLGRSWLPRAYVEKKGKGAADREDCGPAGRTHRGSSARCDRQRLGGALAARERFRISLAERRPQIRKCANLVGIERSGRLDGDGSHHLRPSVAEAGSEREFIRVDGERLDETRSAGRPQLAASDANI